MLGIFVRTLHTDHCRADLLPHSLLVQRSRVRGRWRLDLGDGKAVIELDSMDHPTRDQVSHTFTHVGLGKLDIVRAHVLGDLAVVLGERLARGVGDAQLGSDLPAQSVRFDQACAEVLKDSIELAERRNIQLQCDLEE